jgi:hypothetical protein
MKKCTKCDKTFDSSNNFCPICGKMLVPIIENRDSFNAETKLSNIDGKSGHIKSKGGENCWLFIRRWWYNDFAEKYKKCNLYYEQKDILINHLKSGDKVIFYNKYEFIGSAIIEHVWKDVKFSDIDCSINEIDIPGFFDFGNVIALKDIEIFEPDFTVDVHDLLYDLKLIKGKKKGEDLDKFINSHKWTIRFKGSIKSLDSDDYNLIINKVQELYHRNEKPLEALKNLVLKNDGRLERTHLEGRIFEALGKPEWMLGSDHSFTNNAPKMMKNKLAKVGIKYSEKENCLEVPDLAEGEFLGGDGCFYPCGGYGRFFDDKRIVKLVDIKKQIINGEISDDDGWLTYTNQ